MNYIGSKHKLTPFLMEHITRVVGSASLQASVFCDIFAGTGVVSKVFKPLVKQVISNDFEYFSYVLIRNLIGNCYALDYQPYIDALNRLVPTRGGFIYKHYCFGSGCNRQYFSNLNGMKIDAMRQQIENWKRSGEIGLDMYYFLLASLIESADKVANTASVYGAFLKNLKASAQQELVLEPVPFELSDNDHQAYQEDGNELIKLIEGDILYIDPPYNTRQYGANYHLLNTIARYDQFIPRGKTGLRDYRRSAYCRRREVAQALEDLIANARFRYIFLSYNDEGLLSHTEIRQILQRYGNYDLALTNYHRFKADKNTNRRHKADKTIEYLHILEKDHSNIA